MVIGYWLWVIEAWPAVKVFKSILGIKFYIISYFCGRVQKNVIILYSIVS